MAKVGDTIVHRGKKYVAGEDKKWHEVQQEMRPAPGPLPGRPLAERTRVVERPPDQTPLMERLRWGMVQTPANLMQLAARGLNWIDRGPLSAYGHVPPIELLTGVNTDTLVNAPWEDAKAATYDRLWGSQMPGPPRGLKQKTVGNVGAGLSAPVPGTPGGGTATGLAMEGLGLLAGSGAGALSEELGLSPGAQAGLSTVAAAIPGAAGRYYARQVSLRDQMQAADDVAARIRARASDLPGFVDPDVSPNTVRRVSSELKAMIPEGFEDDAVQRLSDVVAEFPDPRTRPTTSQALDELGGATVESATASLDRGDRTVSRTLAGQKLRAVNAIDDELARLMPDADFDLTQSSYSEIAESAAKAERAAWDAVPMESMPQVPVRTIKQRAAEVRSSVGQAGAKNLPAEIDIIEGYGQTVPFSELQALRSELLTVERAGNSPMATARAMRNGAHAARLRQSVEELIDDVAENSQITGAPLTPGTAATAQRQQGVSALREAQRITRKNRELFSPRSPVVKALNSPKEPQNLARSILTGGPEEARRAMAIFESTPEVQQSVKGIVMRQIVPEDVLTVGAAKASRRRLRVHRRTVVAMFGSKHANNLEKLLRKAQTVRSGRAGTRAAALGTGSNTLQSEAITQLESGMQRLGQRGMIGTAGEFARSQTIGRVRAAFQKEFSAIMAAAAIDPELARDLLAIPGAAAIPKWAARVEQSLARNGVRMAAGAAAEGE